MTFMGSLGALFLKKASSFSSLKNLILDLNFYLGGGLYFLSAILNIYILKYINYSVVLPLTSITYIWTTIISYLILKEKITIKKVLGLASILLGAIFVAI